MPGGGVADAEGVAPGSFAGPHEAERYASVKTKRRGSRRFIRFVCEGIGS
jgi:hypothetical protein